MPWSAKGSGGKWCRDTANLIAGEDCNACGASFINMRGGKNQYFKPLCNPDARHFTTATRPTRKPCFCPGPLLGRQR